MRRLRLKRRTPRLGSGFARATLERVRGLLGVSSPAATTVTLQAVRLLAGTGTTALSSGVPLQPGQLTAANVGNVSLWRNGSEVACYVEALEGRHSDSSVRVLLVQATSTSIASQVPDTGWQLRLATPPLVARAAKNTTPLVRSPATMLLPDGALLPTDADHLCATLFAGKLKTVAQVTASTVTEVKNWDARFPTAEAERLANDTAQPQFPAQINATTGLCYDTGAALFAYWCRTGNWLYWWRGVQMARSWISFQSNVGNSGGSYLQEWHSIMVQSQLYYHATGNLDGQISVRQDGIVWTGPNGMAGNFNQNGFADRQRSKALHALVSGALINATSITSGFYDSGTTNAVAAWQSAGYWPNDSVMITGINQTLARMAGHSNKMLGDDNGTVKCYMQGMCVAALIRYYDLINPLATIPVALKLMSDNLVSSGYTVAGGTAYPYCTTNNQTTVGGDDCNNTQDTIYAELSAMSALYLNAFLYRFYGEPYKSRALAVLTALNGQYAITHPASPFVNSVKFFGEMWYFVQNAFYDLV